MSEVFGAFLQLGLTSFGGPVAHLGYFRSELVGRRRWLDDRDFTDIVAFCTVLPGPTSSQVGMLVGFLRAGPAGALAAWLGFTLPSAVALGLAAALLGAAEAGTPVPPPQLTGLLAGLAAAATGIVAQAVAVMAAQLCTDAPTKTIAAGAAVVALAVAPIAGLQWLPLAIGGLAGAVLLRGSGHAARREGEPLLPGAVPAWAAGACAALFLLLSFGASAWHGAAGTLLATLVRAGSLVFGGGHVVLPLLQSLVPAGLISARDFYAGYGLTQAMPGPLFTFATFLGSANRSPLHGTAGAVAATALIFLPSFLLVFALLPVFTAVRADGRITPALRGASAAVVGLLGALLYSPLLTSMGGSLVRIALALGTYVLVTAWRVAPWTAVVAAGLCGLLAGQLGITV